MTLYIFTTLAIRVPKPRLNKVIVGTSESAVSSDIRTGNGSISGRVTENGVPVSRRVMLYERKTGNYAGQVLSGLDGFYKFDRTNELLTYFVVSIDDTNRSVQFNLKGQDLISGNHDNINSI